MRARAGGVVAVGVLLGSAACVEPLDQGTRRMDAPRVLAVVATPAAAAPGAAVMYAAVVAAPAGPIATPAITWAHCTAPKPPTEDNVVTPPCVDDPFEWTPLGSGATVTAVMPADACRRFGPDTPPGGFRPRDPDASGGYYQPVRAELADAPVAFGLHRIACALGDAPPAVVRDYRARYRANQHPTIATLTVRRGGVELAPPTVAVGEHVDLVVTWPADAAEAYVAYDRRAVTIVDRREGLRVGWFTTAGALAADATGVAADDSATSTTGGRTAPNAAGLAPAWAVLHDDRGGVAVATLAIDVTP